MVWMNLNWVVRDKTGSHGAPWSPMANEETRCFSVRCARWIGSLYKEPDAQWTDFGHLRSVSEKKSWEDHPDSKTSGFSGFKKSTSSLTKPKQEFRHCFGVKSGNRVAALRDDPCPLAWGSISTPTCSPPQMSAMV